MDITRRMGHKGYGGSRVFCTPNMGQMIEAAETGEIGGIVLYDGTMGFSSHTWWLGGLSRELIQAGVKIPPMLVEDYKVTKKFDEFLGEYLPLE